ARLPPGRGDRARAGGTRGKRAPHDLGAGSTGVSAAGRDWRAWHGAYDDPGSSLARRLAVVRARIADTLDAAPPGPLRAVAMCAGQGRDLIPVLASHPRGPDVTA